VAGHAIFWRPRRCALGGRCSGIGDAFDPEQRPKPKSSGYGEAFSKWFGRYKRDLGIDNPSSVFHSFRHGFKDALRAAGVNEDVNDALTGHSGGNSVARGYGWKDMVRRFGLWPARTTGTSGHGVGPMHQSRRSSGRAVSDTSSDMEVSRQPLWHFDCGVTDERGTTAVPYTNERNAVEIAEAIAALGFG
jgi:hypothetical protein